MQNFETLKNEKQQCIKNLNDPKKIETFYLQIKLLSFKELETLFPAPADLIGQSVFDYTNEIIADPSLDSAVSVALSMFHPDNMKNQSDESFKSDMKLLQALFFFLLKDIADGSGKEELFMAALDQNEWRKPEGQAQLLNELCSGMKFTKEKPFKPVDFCQFGDKEDGRLGGVHFKPNESILRLFYNFMHPVLYAKEGIVNELNFVREQQKQILPIFPDTKKTSFSTAGAKKEIENKKSNLDKLRALDSGFYDDDYTQSFFACDNEFKKTFARPVMCKCFAESDLKWDKPPYYNKDKKNWKISFERSLRSEIKSAMNNKFLYSERNMITHISENFAVYKLLEKEYTGNQLKKWKEVLLDSFLDVRQYLLKMQDKAAAAKLMKILNHYFNKLTDSLEIPELNNLTEEERWSYMFSEKGELKLSQNRLNTMNYFDILDDSEKLHFKRFMGLMYCAENDESDFFERNRLRIQIYLIYLSLNLSKLDK